MNKSEQLFGRAKKVMPGGVNSPVRFYDPYPFFATSARGSKLITADKSAGDKLTGIASVPPDMSARQPGSLSATLQGYTVFLDRDGTLNEDPGFLRSASELKLLPGVATALARLKAAGARLVVVTNQSGVGRGFFMLKDLEAIHAIESASFPAPWRPEFPCCWPVWANRSRKRAACSTSASKA